MLLLYTRLSQCVSIHARHCHAKKCSQIRSQQVACGRVRSRHGYTGTQIRSTCEENSFCAEEERKEILVVTENTSSWRLRTSE